MNDLTTALARLKALGVEVPGEDAGRYLALTSDIEGEHKVTVVARGIADAAILELCAVVERLEHIIGQTTGQREYAARKRAVQAEAELAVLKAKYEAAQVCGSCMNYDSFGSALYCCIEVPERIHSYDHVRSFDCRCQYEPSKWDSLWAAREEASDG
jgi:hypothetical protein